MKMISAGAGLGVGIKGYRVVFAFETDEALSNFLNSGLVQDKLMLQPKPMSREERIRVRP